MPRNVAIAWTFRHATFPSVLEGPVMVQSRHRGMPWWRHKGYERGNAYLVLINHLIFSPFPRYHAMKHSAPKRQPSRLLYIPCRHHYTTLVTRTLSIVTCAVFPARLVLERHCNITHIMSSSTAASKVSLKLPQLPAATPAPSLPPLTGPDIVSSMSSNP